MNYENFICAVEGLTKKFHSINPDMYVYINRTDYGLEITCMPRREMRDRWVEQMLAEYCDDFENWSEVVLCDEKRKILVASFEDCWGDNCGYGIAKCSPDDEFDAEVGLAVAFAHFRGYEIPDFV